MKKSRSFYALALDYFHSRGFKGMKAIKLARIAAGTLKKVVKEACNSADVKRILEQEKKSIRRRLRTRRKSNS